MHGRDGALLDDGVVLLGGSDYFIELGRGAYFEVADASRNAYATLFEQLACSYRELVRTLRALRGTPEVPLPVPVSVPRRICYS